MVFERCHFTIIWKKGKTESQTGRITYLRITRTNTAFWGFSNREDILKGSQGGVIGKDKNQGEPPLNSVLSEGVSRAVRGRLSGLSPGV